jgi:glycosyltransferase involved in cell wall biosynthesis
MKKPLRILGIVNLPWDPRLGASRVWFELAAQWENLGHQFKKFSLSDAFPKPTSSRALSAWRQAFFPYRAARFVREHGGSYDVIDCLIGTLPFSKRSLRFTGLLVARSIGLYLDYAKFIRFSRERWPDQPRGKFVGRLFYTFTSWLLQRNGDRALDHCDLFNVPNDEEKLTIQQRASGIGAIVLPYGLTDSERAAFAAAGNSPRERLARKEICFLGMWSLRKGSRDWPEIVRAVLSAVPDARFVFLGTMTGEQTVLRDFEPSSHDAIRCVNSYEPQELPNLLAGCAVGLFPSYIEGFGISVIEQLASGIPTIAYDVPGPHHIFEKHHEFLVPSGDTKAIAARAIEVLRMNESEYDALSAKCREIAARFRWEQIAAHTIREYEAALAQMRSADQLRKGETLSV